MKNFLGLGLGLGLGLAVLSVLGSVSLASAAECQGYSALQGKDIVFKPGETQTFLYDFRDPSCTTSVRGFWAYIADSFTPSAEGCSTNVTRNARVTMSLVDLTSGVQGTVVSSTSVILNDPVPDANGNLLWGSYNVKGHLLQLQITLDPALRKCLKANLRYAYAMGG